jgi:hypothetical protein
MQVGVIGQQSSERRLAAAGRSPEDHRGEPARRQHAPDGRIGRQQMLLADDILQLGRAKPVGQRAGRQRFE